MKLPQKIIPLALLFLCVLTAMGQRRSKAAVPRDAIGVVIDERLSVLRDRPSLFGKPVQRMRVGRRVQIYGTAEGDGVRFYKVVSSGRTGWLQTDAVINRSVPDDETRLARLIQASDGFSQVELSFEFLRIFPTSRLRPAMLLLLGDILEQAAVKISRDTSSRLDRREMAVSGAPIHSFYLNSRLLDRYRRLGVTFLFDAKNRKFHYDGASWREIVRRYPDSNEAVEAKKRLDSIVKEFPGQ